jgi:predicted esterase
MIRIFNFLLCLSFVVSAMTANGQQVFKTTSSSVIGYLEYLPEHYHENSNDYPVVIFLHGRGEKGPNSTNPEVLARGVSELTKLGPPHYVKNGTKFPFILISPQLKSGFGDWPTWYIHEVIEHVKKQLRIDENRIYLTGLSLGGGGVWTAAQANPGLFAAIAPVCGSRNSITKADGIARNNLPVWAFHGDKDPTIPLARSVNMVNAINAFHPDPRARMTIYPGVKHNAWDKAYKPDHSEHSPNIYEWMLSYTRKSSSSSSETIANIPPVVNAGNDKSISEKEATLDLSGSASDPDGKIKKYEWNKSSGGEVTMDGKYSSRLSISHFKKGTYIFRLTVTDDKGSSQWDEVKVTVNSTSGTLVAYAGPDRKVKLPVSTYKMSGGATSPDGYIVSYEWRQLDGDHVTILNANQRVMEVLSVSTPGKRTLELIVKDTKGRIASDKVRLYFEEPKTSGKSAISSMGEVVDDPAQLLDAAESLSGASDPSNPTNWKNKFVTVFNDRGERIYMGKWNEDSYTNTFPGKGLYIYHLTVDGKRIRSGKVFIDR